MTGVQTCALPICFPVTIGPVGGGAEGVVDAPEAVGKEGTADGSVVGGGG